jgi:nondiscriminating glutamyl-tRNA synthetase
MMHFFEWNYHSMKTRFAPSPTGQMHLGNVRTALFSYLLARYHQGIFLLRIEDTDKIRSKPEHIQLLKEDLDWLELHWNEGPFFQSERQAIYDEYYAYLEEHHAVYPCFCSDEQLALARKIQLSASQPPRYTGTCRGLSAAEIESRKKQGMKPVLRFKVPEDKEILFQDIVKGPQRFQTDDIGDFIIRRADGSASFFFSNAIDDALMGVTDTIRGEDHLTNTPRQILILTALGLTIPHYGHVPLILSAEGGPLSKREGSLSVESLRKEGFLPIALCNYLGRLGHYYEKNHLMGLEEMAADFSVSRIGKTPAHFDKTQLLHWQKLAVMQSSEETFWQWLTPDTQKWVPEDCRHSFITLMRTHVLFPAEAEAWAKIFFLESDVSAEAAAILENTAENFLVQLKESIEEEGADYPQVIQSISQHSHLKGKALFQPLRAALTGQTAGPELAGIFKLLGKKRLLERIKCVS